MFFKTLREDAEAYLARDPAARSTLEVAVLYQGFHALVFYRVSNWLWRHDLRFLGRWLSQFGRWLTQIEIHPGAVIGRRLVIDHGAGVVIGETAEIGDDVTLYHDVTLGGVAPSVDSASQVGTKRHPTLRDGVIVGCGSSILGPITVGESARIGANAVVTKDVPAHVTAVGNPANVVMPKDKDRQREFQAYGTPLGGIPDPVLQTLESLRRQVNELKTRVRELEDGAEPETGRTDGTGESERGSRDGTSG